MKTIIVGTGGCGFLRVYNFLINQGKSVAYKQGKVKFQNSFETWNEKTGLVWNSELLTKKDRLFRAQFYLNSFHQDYDISHAPLKYVEEILEIEPKTKIVCIQGDYHRTIDSLLVQWAYRNPCATERGKYRTRYVLQQFPDYSDQSMYDATKSYVEEYNKTALQLLKQFPDNFTITNCFDYTGQENTEEEFVTTTTLHGGLGNNLFQMAECVAFCDEYGLKKPVFGTWNLQNGGGIYPPAYNADHFLGRHTGSHEEFINCFSNINWIKEKTPTFDTKFMINDMFSFSVVHHQRSAILEAFKPSESVLKYIDEKYSNLYNKPTVSLHLRTCTLAADDHVNGNVPLEFHQKSLASFSDDHTVLVFSDNNTIAEQYISTLKQTSNKEFVLIKENQFISLFMISKCNHNILHVSTFSFWGAYLKQNQETSRTIVPAEFIKCHTKDMIPYNTWEISNI